MNKYGVPKELIIGFGDSGNDEAFLSYLDHAMIMSNSQDEEMKSKFKIQNILIIKVFIHMYVNL